MSMLYVFKPQKDRALHSASRTLLAAGVTPNMVTAAGLLMSAAAGHLAGRRIGAFYVLRTGKGRAKRP